MNKFIHQKKPLFNNKEAEACYEYMKTDMWLTEFKKTNELEQMICHFTGIKYCHMVNNGTISLSIALLALDIKKDDIVIIPNFTMIATPNAVKLIGAKPLLVDVEEDTLCINIDEVEKLLQQNDKIKCVIHVSLNARCNDIIKLKEICNKNNVSLLEDSAQSLGSFYKNKHLGTFGDIGSFSFSSPKIISTGQGGALITNNKDLSDKIMRIKNFGRDGGGNDIHNYFGINSKFTDIQAVIGIEQMKKLPNRVKRMKKIWNLYYKLLSINNNIYMFKPNDDGWIPWFIDIYIENPKDLQKYLKEKNIGTRLVYPPIHKQNIYKKYNDLLFSNTEKYSYKGLWLPSSTDLLNEEIKEICKYIIEFYKC